jgi:hypothetical protein
LLLLRSDLPGSLMYTKLERTHLGKITACSAADSPLLLFRCADPWVFFVDKILPQSNIELTLSVPNHFYNE